MLDKMREMIDQEKSEISTLDQALDVAINALQEIAIYAVYGQPANCEYEAKKALDALQKIKELNAANTSKEQK